MFTFEKGRGCEVEVKVVRMRAFASTWKRLKKESDKQFALKIEYLVTIMHALFCIQVGRVEGWYLFV